MRLRDLTLDHMANGLRRRLGLKQRQDGESGLAIVEFALILPLLILMLLGSVDLTRAMMADRKLSTMASSIGDLIAREEVVDDVTVNQIFQAVAPLMTPYNAAMADIRVSSIEVVDNGNSKEARVLWSRGKNMAPRAPGSTVAAPDAILENTEGLVYVEGGFDYQPLFGIILSGPVSFAEDFYFVPRVSNTIELE
jgi:Flp pilus assembly protein TadG